MSNFDDKTIKYIKDVFDFVNENNENFINFDDMKKGIIALGGEIIEKEEENLKENKFNFDDLILLETFVLEVESVLHQTLLQILRYVVESHMDAHRTYDGSAYVKPYTYRKP